MITHTMKSVLPTAKATAFYDFMINAPQDIYKRWLPKEHHEFHIVKRGINSPIGDLIYSDQHIGNGVTHRLNFHALTRIAEKPNRVLFQMRKFGINLPGYLELMFCDTAEGLHLAETIRIGYKGFGKIFDPGIRLVFNQSFFREMDGHHKREWTNLAEILQQKNRGGEL